MVPLEPQQLADRSVVPQRLDMPQVELPPEESSLNLTDLVPELNLLGEKEKDKKDESDEEVSGNSLFFYLFTCKTGEFVVHSVANLSKVPNQEK